MELFPIPAAVATTAAAGYGLLSFYLSAEAITAVSSVTTIVIAVKIPAAAEATAIAVKSLSGCCFFPASVATETASSANS